MKKFNLQQFFPRLSTIAIGLIISLTISFIDSDNLQAQPCDLAAAILPGDTIPISIALNSSGCGYLDGVVLYAASISSGLEHCRVYRIWYNNVPVAASYEDGLSCPGPMGLDSNVTFTCTGMSCGPYDGTGKQFFEVQLDQDCELNGNESAKIWIQVFVRDKTGPECEARDTTIDWNPFAENLLQDPDAMRQFYLDNNLFDASDNCTLQDTFFLGIDTVPNTFGVCNNDTVGKVRVCWYVTDTAMHTSDTCCGFISFIDTLPPYWNEEATCDSLAAGYPGGGIDTVANCGADPDNPFQKSVFLDCNDPNFDARLNYLLSEFGPIAEDDCSNVKVEKVYVDTMRFVCETICEREKVYTRYICRWNAKDSCGHYIETDGMNADSTYLLNVYIRDTVAPGFHKTPSPITDSLNTETVMGMDSIKYTGDTVTFYTYDPSDPLGGWPQGVVQANDTFECKVTILTDTLSIWANDCRDSLSYAWKINTTFLCDTVNFAPFVDSMGTGPDITKGVDSINMFPVGTHDIVYTAEDSCGNIASFCFTLEVIDNTPPILDPKGFECGQMDTIWNVANLCEATYCWDPDLWITDNCNPDTLYIEILDPDGKKTIKHWLADPNCLSVKGFQAQLDPDDWTTSGNVQWFPPAPSQNPDSLGLFGNDDDCAWINSPVTGVLSFNWGAMCDEDDEGGCDFDDGEQGTLFVGGEEFNFVPQTDGGGDDDAAEGYFQVPVEQGQEIRFCATNSGGDSVALYIYNLNINCHAAFAVFPVGTSEIRHIGSDIKGNYDTCSLFVTVEDEQAPWAICVDSTTVSLNMNCEAFVNTAMVDAGSGDNCKLGSMRLRGNGQEGQTIYFDTCGVWYLDFIVQDKFGHNEDTCQVKVTVEDNIAPTIDCPADVILNTGTNNADCTADYTWPHPSGQDNCSVDMVTVEVVGVLAETDVTTLGTTLDDLGLGLYEVIYRVYAKGKVAQCNYTIEVRDNEAPDITIDPPTCTADTSGGCGAVVNYTYNVTDECDGSPVVVATPPSGTVLPLGPNTIQVIAIDASGNADTATTTVNVTDKNPPTAVCADVTVDLDATGKGHLTAGEVDAGTDDNCSLDTFWIGRTEYTCSDTAGPVPMKFFARDAAGNMDTCDFLITVRDSISEPTVLDCPADLFLFVGNNCTVVANYPTPKVGIGCAGTAPMNFVSGPVNGVTLLSPGEYPVKFNYPLNNGQGFVECNFNLIVKDSTAPTVTYCPDDTLVYNLISCDNMNVFFNEPQATDNCGIVDTIRNHAPGDAFPVGCTLVSYTFIDARGNQTTCEFNVCVADNTAPEVSCSDITFYLDNCGRVFRPIKSSNLGIATDECGIAERCVKIKDVNNQDFLFCDTLDLDCKFLGTNYFWYWATDKGGNVSDTVDCLITVLDTIPPIACCLNDTCIYTNVKEKDSCFALFDFQIPFVQCADDGESKPDCNAGNNPFYYDNDSCNVKLNWTITQVEDCDGPVNKLLGSGVVFGPDGLDLSNFPWPVGRSCLEIRVSETHPLSNGFVHIDTCYINVVDTIAPWAAVCPPDTCIGTNQGQDTCFAKYTWDHPTFIDNCSVDSVLVKIDYPAGACYPDGSPLTDTSFHVLTDRSACPDLGSMDWLFPKGETQVSYCVWDNCSFNDDLCGWPVRNMADTCQFTVTVKDSTPVVVAYCPSDCVVGDTSWVNVPTTTSFGQDTCECYGVHKDVISFKDNCDTLTLIKKLMYCGAPFPPGPNGVEGPLPGGGFVPPTQCDTFLYHKGTKNPITWNYDFPVCDTLPKGDWEYRYYAIDCGGFVDSCVYKVRVYDDKKPEFQDAICEDTIVTQTLTDECSREIAWDIPELFADNCKIAGEFEYFGIDPGGKDILILSIDPDNCDSWVDFTGDYSPGNWQHRGDQAGNVNGTPAQLTITDPIGNGGTFACLVMPYDGVVSFTLTGTNVNCGIPQFSNGGYCVNSNCEDMNNLEGTFCEVDRQFSVSLYQGDTLCLWALNGQTEVTNFQFLCGGAMHEAEFPRGLSKVYYIINDGMETDTCGQPIGPNYDTCCIWVRVMDDQPPVVECEDTVYINLDDDGTAILTVNDIINASWDNCGIDSTWITDTDLTCADTAGTEISAIARDLDGNLDTCTSTVIAVPTNVPTVLACPGDQTYYADGVCEAVVDYNIPTVQLGCVGVIPMDHILGPMDGETISGVQNTTVRYEYDYSTQGGLSGTLVCEFEIKLVDTLDPVITLIGTPVCSQNPAGNCGAVVTYDFDVDDNCDGDPVALGIPASGSVFPLGMNVIQIIAIDDSGNSDTLTVEIDVTDKNPPNAVCTDVTVNLNAAGMGFLTPGEVNAGCSDNCSIDSLWLSQTKFTCDDAPSTTVFLYAGDEAGLIDSCEATVTVLDIQDPIVLDCQGNIFRYADANCLAPGDIDTPLVAVGCGGTDVMNPDPGNPGGPLGPGVYPYSFTYPTQNGSTVECNGNLVVLDSTPPFLTFCPNDTVLIADPGNCSVENYNFVEPTAEDNCGIALIIRNHEPGDQFNVGNTLVSYVFVDEAGNSVKCEWTVTIRDQEDPSVICTNDKIFYLDDCGRVVTPVKSSGLAIASDDCGILDECLIVEVANGGTIETCDTLELDCKALGINNYGYYATDAGGNISDTVFCEFTVLDTTPPVSCCLEDICISTDLQEKNACYGTYDLKIPFVQCASDGLNQPACNENTSPFYYDNDSCGTTLTYTITQIEDCGGSVNNLIDSNTVIAPETLDLSQIQWPVGVSKIDIVVTDAAGLSVKSTCTITVIDATPPWATCPADDTVGTNDVTNMNCVWIGQLQPPVITDNCAVDLVKVTIVNTFKGEVTTVKDEYLNLFGDPACPNIGPVDVELPKGRNAVTYTYSDACDNDFSDNKENVYAILSGTNEVPPVNSPATGSAYGTYDFETNTLEITVEFENLSAPTNLPLNPGPGSGQIYAGQAGQNGIYKFILDVPKGVTEGSFSSTHTLTEAQEVTLTNEGFYVNILSEAFMSGELRGQLKVGDQNTGTCSYIIEVEDDMPPMAMDCPETECVGEDPALILVPATESGPGLGTPFDFPENCVCYGLYEDTVTFKDDCDTMIVRHRIFDGNGKVVFDETSHYNKDSGNYNADTKKWSYGFSNKLHKAGSDYLYVIEGTDCGEFTDKCEFVVRVFDDVPPVIEDCPVDTVKVEALWNECFAEVTWDIPMQLNDNCKVLDDYFWYARHHDQDILVTTVDPVGCVSKSGFTGPFSPAFWQEDLVNGQGNVVKSFDEFRIRATGPFGPADGFVTVCIEVEHDGLISFNWNRDFGFGQIGWFIDGGAGDFLGNGSGSATIPVNSGDVFCYFAYDFAFSTQMTVTNFHFTCGGAQHRAIFPVGINEVNYVLSDGMIYDNCGVLTGPNYDTCTIIVEILDEQPPLALCTDITVELEDDGTAFISAADIDGGSSDNCALGSLSVVPMMFNCDNLGDNTVTLTATDESGNTATCTANVFVIENSEPILVNCPAEMTFQVSNDEKCEAAVTYATPQVSLGCSGLADMEYVSGPESGQPQTVGNYTVVYSYVLPNGDNLLCQFAVNVVDNSPPVIFNVPDDITQSADEVSCTATVTWPEPFAEDNCCLASFAGTAASGDVFPVGVTTVTYTAIDCYGNSTSESFTVTVSDDEAPVANCIWSELNPLVVYLDQCGLAEIIADDAGVATDNCVNPERLVEYGNEGPASSIQIDCNNVNVVDAGLFIATDGVLADTCEFYFTVLDRIAPEVICPPNVTLQLADYNPTGCDITGYPGSNIPFFDCNGLPFPGPGYHDNDLCNVLVEWAVYNSSEELVASDSVENGEEVDFSEVTFGCGAFRVEVTVSDASDEDPVSCEFNVTVEDNVDPEITCGGPFERTANAGLCSFTMQGKGFDPVASDNCPEKGLTITHDYTSAPSDTSLQGATFPVGDTFVTWTATDGSNNTSTCIILITIVDREDPTITCPGNIAVGNDPDICGAVVDYELPEINDNCPFDTFMTNPPTFPGYTFAGKFGSNFYYASAGATSWFNHQLIANLNGGYLVSISSPEENDFVGNIAASFPDPVYIGIGDPDNNSIYTWTSGEPVTYTNWVSAPTCCTAGGINGSTGTWSQSDPFIGRPAILEIPAEPDRPLNLNRGLAPGTVFPVGETVVEWMVTDKSGNSATCSFTVTVEDIQAPEFHDCPTEEIVVNVTLNECDQDVNFPVPVDVWDNCDTGNLALNGQVEEVFLDPDGNTNTILPLYAYPDVPFNATFGREVQNAQFAVGTSMALYIATDSAGNKDTCTVKITVLDDEPPQIDCPPTQILGTTCPESEVPDYSNLASVTDNCNASVTFTQDPPIGATLADLGIVLEAGSSFSVTLEVADANDSTQTTSCTFTVILENFTNPVPTVSPMPVFESGCGEACVDAPTATGDCGEIIYGIPIGTLPICGPNQYLFPVGNYNQVWLYIDSNGQSATQVQTFNITEDMEDPKVDCQNATVTLDENGEASIQLAEVFVSSTDNCDDSLDVVASQSTFNCNDVPGVTVIVSATDDAGNTGTCQAEVTVIDNIDPVVQCSDITVELDENGEGTIAVDDVLDSATDNCEVVSNVLSKSDFTCGDIGDNEVMITATDPSGNTGVCFLNVFVVDNRDPVALCNDVTVELDENGEGSFSIGDLDNGSSDNCIDLDMELSCGANADDPVCDVDCSDLGENMVVLTATDGSGNQSECTSTVTVEDNMAPVLDCPEVIESCCSDVCFSVSATDNCEDVAITWGFVVQTDTGAVGIPGSGPEICYADFPIGETIVSIGAEDSSGNTAFCQVKVRVTDDQPPVPICTGNLGLTLGLDGMVSIPVQVLGGASFDLGCGFIESMQVSINDGPIGDTAVFTCDHVDDDELFYTIYLTDCAGNSSSCWAYINIDDKTAPFCVANDVSVEFIDGVTGCDETYLAKLLGEGSVDNCTDFDDLIFTVNGEDSITVGPDDAPGFTYTLTVEDESGNASECQGTVDIEISVPPCNDITLHLDESGQAVLDPVDVVGTEGGENCAADQVIISQSDFDCSDIGVNQITVTLVSTQGGEIVCEAMVTVLDTIAPTCDTIPDIFVELDVNGFGEEPALDLSGIDDNCAVENLIYDIGSFDCSDIGENVVLITVSDSSGNETLCEATVIVEDKIVPSFVCDQTHQVVLNSAGIGTLAPEDIIEEPQSIIDNCPGPLTRGVSKSMFNCSELGSQEVIAFVEDASGNVNACTTVVEVVANDPALDIVPIISVTDETACNTNDGKICITDVQDGIGNSIFDDVIFVWSTGGVDSCIENLSAGDYSVLITNTETNCGRLAEATVNCMGTLTLDLAGAIESHMPLGAPISCVDVFLTKGDDQQIQTDDNGLYNFVVDAGEDYIITPLNDVENTSGVNILDLLLIQQHILLLNPLTSEYQKIAADVDNNGAITIIDLVVLQAWILGSLPNGLASIGNTAWRFIPQDYSIPPTSVNHSANLLGFPESIEYVNVLEDKPNGNFFGIKIGDVSGDANLDLCGSLLKGDENSEERTPDKLFFRILERQVSEGEVVSIDFTARDFRNINGYQFTLEFDRETLDFAKVQTGELKNLSEDMFGFNFLEEGKITGLWYDAVPQNLEDDAVLFSLVFTAKADSDNLSRLLNLTSDKLQAQAIDGNGETMNLDLDFVGGEHEEFALLQNTPNPFRNQTTIGFILPDAAKATLTVMDVSGRLLKVIEGDFKKGYNEVTLNKSEIPVAGVLYYKLETPDNTATKRMIMIE